MNTRSLMLFSRPLFWALFALLTLVAAAGCSTIPGAVSVPTRSSTSASKHAQLAQALAGADRVVIAPTAIAGAPPASREIGGREVVEEFLEHVKFDEAFGAVRSRCPSDGELTFHLGARSVSLSLHRLGYLRWENGPWEGDAVLTVESSRWLQRWARQAGLDLAASLQRRLAERTQEQEAAFRRSLGRFTPAARSVFATADAASYNGAQIRRVATPLANHYADKAALADACFLALGDHPKRWLEDDWAIGAIQETLLRLEPSLVFAALERALQNETATLGAARFFFRCELGQTLSAAERDVWAVRFAGTVLERGAGANKPTVLEYVAAIPGEATAGFLRAIARGERSHSFSPPCHELVADIDEPSLPFIAALWLAQRGDPQAEAIAQTLALKTPFGPDRAALDIAQAFASGATAVAPAHFKYASRTLGLNAIAILARSDGGSLPVATLAAATQHVAIDVSTRAEQIARRWGLGRTGEAEDELEDERALALDPLLAFSHPELAVETYTAAIATAKGRALARLHALRAQAHYSLRNYVAAEADYLEAQTAPELATTDLYTRLAWAQWYLGKIEAAQHSIARGLTLGPDAELVLLRGLIRYSQDDVSQRAELDFAAAAVMDPTDGYAPLFQHLTATLGGRGNQSHLQESISTNSVIPDWPRQVAGYVLGFLDARHLLRLALASEPHQIAYHTCEAHFYVSQMARIEGRTDDEKYFLEQCVATEQPNVAEYWLAKYRLRRLVPVEPPPVPGSDQVVAVP